MTDSTGVIVTPPTLAELRQRRKPTRNIHKEHKQSLGLLDRMACRITEHVGTMGFFLIILTWTAIWLNWNFFAPKALRFDPPMGFVFYLFISNVIQILLMPLIMVGQNIQGAHSEARAEHDLEINVKAEEEIELVLHHLEEQNALLLAMVERLDMDIKDRLPKP